MHKVHQNAQFFPNPHPTCHVVGRKVGWMVRVVILHEEEFPDGHGTQCQHGGAQLSQRFPVQNHAPQVNAIPWMSPQNVAAKCAPPTDSPQTLCNFL